MILAQNSHIQIAGGGLVAEEKKIVEMFRFKSMNGESEVLYLKPSTSYTGIRKWDIMMEEGIPLLDLEKN